MISVNPQIEERILQLSLQDQVQLMEWLASTIRRNSGLVDSTGELTVREDIPAAMADDPEIQAELSAIQAEFAVTDLDGLRSP
ncbi:MAG: hypothetical protein HC802_11940 [Caldilineaceae bacterium]|nr:hypothetical protein [Caldilineaceae bacterium]